MIIQAIVFCFSIFFQFALCEHVEIKKDLCDEQHEVEKIKVDGVLAKIVKHTGVQVIMLAVVSLLSISLVDDIVGPDFFKDHFFLKEALKAGFYTLGFLFPLASYQDVTGKQIVLPSMFIGAPRIAI